MGEPDDDDRDAAEPFPLSPSQVRKAGDRIRRAASARESPSEEDLQILDLFRSWHGEVHNKLQLQLGEAIFGREGHLSGSTRIAARPLKTHEAIIAKLVRDRSRLNRMQDIVGARIAVPDLAGQQAALEMTLSEFSGYDAVIAKDTRSVPDELGYRAVHVVLAIDGRYAEVQIRTELQGLWAQAVEKLDEVLGSDLKHGSGEPDLRRRLNEISAQLQKAEQGDEAAMTTTAAIMEMLVSLLERLSKEQR